MTLHEAGRDDVGALVGLMHDFYAEAGYELVEQRAASAFEELLRRPDLGRVWLIEREGSPASAVAPAPAGAAASQAAGHAAGYIVVTFVFAMEHGGLAAVVDDFYVCPEARGKGLGKAALAAVRLACEDLGVRAMRVEVGEDNAAAQAVYRGAGFDPLPGHALMQASLAPPSHAT